jgi:hypothetical protein
MMLAQESGVDQVLIGALAGLLVIVIPLGVRGFRKLIKDVHDLKVAVVGEPANDYHPEIPGLVKIVDGIVTSQKANLQGTAALIRDSKPDDGSSSRDVLDRIDQATQDTPEP